MRTAIVCLICVLGGSVLSSAQRPDAADGGEDSTARLLERFLSADDTRLTSYRARRTLEATSRGGKMKARLTASTSNDPVRGFQYSIEAEEGSGIIRQKVLRAALEAERTLADARERARGAITRANYEFIPSDVAAGDGLVRIAMQPKRRDTMLLDGSMLLTADVADLARVEGRLTKRPSFWTRSVDVVRRYARIAGVRVPVSLQSTAQVLIAGRSTFLMTYEYESINGEAVTADEVDEALREDAPPCCETDRRAGS